MSQPCTIDTAGNFITRPTIGNRFLGPCGQVRIIASIWSSGIVFEQGPAVSATELLSRFKPECPECKNFHEPDYPHDYTSAFRDFIARTEGRAAQPADTFKHCAGLIKACAECAHQTTEEI